MEVKEKLGEGMTAEVYEIDRQYVLKLFYSHIPNEWVDYEYNLAHSVGELYESAPRAYEIIDYDGRKGIVYDRAYGNELSELLKAKVSRCIEFGVALADIHSHMHKIVVDNLPLQKDIYFNAIEESRDILGEWTNRLQEMAKDLVYGDYICHGDLHLGNVMLSNDEYKVIDWMGASQGNPIADVCRSMIMLETPYSLHGIPYTLKLIVRVILFRTKRAYLKRYCELNNVTVKEIRSWLPIVAGARIRENIPGEKKWLINMIRRNLK
ncbi:MAG: aminoglycoside phosphotransferase family protein [Vallitaleaceae bacterium]|jgi:aminoglycoside phosphotransferase (APT) family kinase protein|nr:aminoglycoside phosphotransferase family protein [Vallitaleaceae bacterium]